MQLQRSNVFLIWVCILLAFGFRGLAEECPNDSAEDYPVCGSDGNIYPSKCEMESQNFGKNLTVKRWGFCSANKLCPLVCLKIYDPVCGEDGKIYSNKCLMQKENCGKQINSVPLEVCTEKTRNSRYIERCPKICLHPDKPVCGSDGHIYRNECVLRLKNCGKDVKLVKMSECISSLGCPKKCMYIQDPVCGSNGKIYLNECVMRRETCKEPVVKLPLFNCTVK